MDATMLRKAMITSLPTTLLKVLPLSKPGDGGHEGLFKETLDFCKLVFPEEDEARRLGVRMSQWMSPMSPKAGRMPLEVKQKLEMAVASRLRADVSVTDFMKAFNRALERIDPNRFRVRFTHVKQTDLSDSSPLEEVVVVSKSASRLMRPAILGPIARKIDTDASGLSTVPVLVLVKEVDQLDKFRTFLEEWISEEHRLRYDWMLPAEKIRGMIATSERKGSIQFKCAPELVGAYEGPDPITLRFGPGNITAYRHGSNATLEHDDEDLERVNRLVDLLEEKAFLKLKAHQVRKKAAANKPAPEPQEA